MCFPEFVEDVAMVGQTRSVYLQFGEENAGKRLVVLKLLVLKRTVKV